MRTTRTMQSAYNRHAAGMQTAVEYGCRSTTKEDSTSGIPCTKNCRRKVYEMYYLGSVLNKMDLEAGRSL